MWVIQSELRAAGGAGGVTGAATLDPGVSPALRSLSGHVFCESHRAVSPGPQVEGLVVTILLLCHTCPLLSLPAVTAAAMPTLTPQPCPGASPALR